jgi:hypothetical protein
MRIIGYTYAAEAHCIEWAETGKASTEAFFLSKVDSMRVKITSPPVRRELFICKD